MKVWWRYMLPNTNSFDFFLDKKFFLILSEQECLVFVQIISKNKKNYEFFRPAQKRVRIILDKIFYQILQASAKTGVGSWRATDDLTKIFIAILSKNSFYNLESRHIIHFMGLPVVFLYIITKNPVCADPWKNNFHNFVLFSLLFRCKTCKWTFMGI